MTATWKARITLALEARRKTLCEYLLTWATTPESDRSHGPEWVAACVKSLDEIEAQLTDSGPLVERVMEAVEKAKQSIPKHSKERP